MGSLWLWVLLLPVLLLPILLLPVLPKWPKGKTGSSNHSQHFCMLTHHKLGITLAVSDSGSGRVRFAQLWPLFVVESSTAVRPLLELVGAFDVFEGDFCIMNTRHVDIAGHESG
jgi:hypothetical protein